MSIGSSASTCNFTCKIILSHFKAYFHLLVSADKVETAKSVCVWMSNSTSLQNFISPYNSSYKPHSLSFCYVLNIKLNFTKCCLSGLPKIIIIILDLLSVTVLCCSYIYLLIVLNNIIFCCAIIHHTLPLWV